MRGASPPPILAFGNAAIMSAHSPAVASPAPLDHAAVRSIIIGIMLAMLLAALDQTIVATALPTIGRELGDVEHLSWVVSAYLLAATAVTPLYGKFSDIHGRRISLLVSISVFVVGSVACALAPTMLVLILARGLQGLGGGGLISLAQTIIADVVSPKERGRYQGYIASVFVTSSVVGPVLGGLFADHLHWSVIFWINLPLGLGAFWMVWDVLRRLPRHDRKHRLDVLGAVLMVGATVAAMLALTWGGAGTYPWGSAAVLGLFAVSLVLWVLFAIRLLTAEEPLIPLAVMFNPVVGTGTAAAFCVMGSFIGLSIYVPVYLEGVIGLSASNSGLALMPLMAGTVTGANIAGRFMARIAHYKRTPLVGLVVATAALVGFALHPAGLPLWLVEVLLAAIGLGLGTVLPVTTISIQNAVAMHQLGTATACMNFFRSLGSAIVVAGFGAIVLGAIGGRGRSAENLGELTPAMRDGLVGAFHWLFLAAAVGLALGFVWLLLMEERPLRSGAAAHAKEALVE